MRLYEMQVVPPCSDNHFGWDRDNQVFQVSLFPAVGCTIGLQGHRGIGASGAFPAATLSLDFSFPMCISVCVGCKIQSIRNRVLSAQQAQKEYLTQEIISSFPSLARAVLRSGCSLGSVFGVQRELVSSVVATRLNFKKLSFSRFPRL